MAIGLTHYKYMPPNLASLPEEFVTHSSKHNTVDNFKGRDVAVVGGGASALDLAAITPSGWSSRPGSRPQTRNSFPRSTREARPLVYRAAPQSDDGHWPWLESCILCTNAPLVFRQMPQKVSIR